MTPSNGSNCSRFDWSPAYRRATARGRGRGKCWTGSTPNSVPSLTPVELPRSMPFSVGWTAVSSGPARPVHRRAAGRMCFRQVVISSRSMYGQFRPLRPGGSASSQRNVWSKRYWQEAGEWPRAIALSAWGTANMRTGGDDVAQALALIGARPLWEETSGRVTGFAITPLERTETSTGRRYLSCLRAVPRCLSDADGHHRQRHQCDRRAR